MVESIVTTQTNDSKAE